jgi:cytochrome c biogenesis protein
VFSWLDVRGIVTGSVNLPSFPAREFEQAQYWQIPDTNKLIWSQLVPEKKIVTLEQAFELGELDDHHIVMRFDDQRFEMQPGDEVKIGGGTLYYKGVRQWMGYKIVYDWTRPWMIAACLMAIIAMMFYFISKFRSSPLEIPDQHLLHRDTG